MGQVYVRASRRSKAYTRSSSFPNKLARLNAMKATLHSQVYKKGRKGINKRLNAVTKMRDAERQLQTKLSKVHVMGGR